MYRKDNNMDQVPTDWNVMIFYYVDRKIFWGSKKIHVRTWVSELEPGDQESIKTNWQPTSAEYISPEEKERREAEARLEAERKEQERIEALL